MPPWRHSLFALVLATRSYSNFALWCEINQLQGRTEFLNALKQCWAFHYDKFNHIDLEEAFDQVEPYLPLDLEEYTEGDNFAFDVAVMLDVALSSVPMSSKNAQDASSASMASVIRRCEHTYVDRELDEDALIELEEIQNELKYQIDLMYKVMEPRSEDNIKDLLKFALEPELSNIGIANELSYDDFSSCFVIDKSPKTSNSEPQTNKAKPKPNNQSQKSKQDRDSAIDDALVNFDAFDLENDLDVGELSEYEQSDNAQHNVYGKVDAIKRTSKPKANKNQQAKGSKGKSFKSKAPKKSPRIFTSKSQ